MEKRLHHFLLFFILTTIIIYPSISSRPLENTNPNPFITFLISDVLVQTTPSLVPEAHNIGWPPFSGPTGLFSPKGDTPTTATNGATTSWLSFLTSVRGLELVNATEIEEQLTGSRAVGLPLKGKVLGMYVTSSVDGEGAMVAMMAVFGDGKNEDSLRFFGEYEPDRSESHIAVVGGSGRYGGANGFAVVKAVGDGKRKKRSLLFTVYIK